MSRSKLYQNVKIGTAIGSGAVGPQTLTAAQTYFSQPIPCRGAKFVLCRHKSTDSNTPGTITFAVISGLTSTAQSAVGVGYNVRGTNNINMLGTGLQFGLGHGDGVFQHDYVCAQITANAGSNHTAYQCDIEVFYDGDADDVRSSVGQFLAQPL
jgi:hypothetical protein